MLFYFWLLFISVLFIAQVINNNTNFVIPDSIRDPSYMGFCIMKTYVVYILANKPQGTLYIGITSDLKRRIIEHRNGLCEGFTQEYNVKILVYIEQYQYVDRAITREKQLKNWLRQWKIDLVEERNPEWNDLYETIFGPEEKMDPGSSPG